MLISGSECADEASQIEKLLSPKRSPTGGNDIERVLRDEIRPGRRNGAQTALTAPKECTVLVPVLATHDQVELLPEERVVRVGNPKKSSLDGPKRRS